MDTIDQVLAPSACVGEVYWVVLPVPSWPLSFQPQHHSVYVVARMAQVAPSPAATATYRFAESTCTGLYWSVVLPMPSWPTQLPPQHHRVLSVLMAQVASLPAATVAQLVAVPTWTRVERPTLSPWPRASPANPTHQMVPSLRMAHMWVSPMATYCQVPSAPTWLGLCTGYSNPPYSC